MDIVKSIKIAHQKAQERGWDKVYWLIDLHGVIIKPTYEKDDFGKMSRYEYCVDVLQKLSEDAGAVLILFTSSYEEYLSPYLEWMSENGIHFDYINENPLEKNNEICDFSSKYYFNILLDDKAGFEPEKDWEVIHKYIINNSHNE